jgi:hypothetical protein
MAVSYLATVLVAKVFRGGRLLSIGAIEVVTLRRSKALVAEG